MKEIQLPHNKLAMVDDTDFDMLREFGWVLTSTGYAIRSCRGKTEYMHRLILNLPALSVDHIDGNKLNNQKSNLRAVSQGINMYNKRTNSKFRGVSWCKTKLKWRSNLTKDKKQYSFGYHDSPESAHRAYLEGCIKIHGFLPHELSK